MSYEKISPDDRLSDIVKCYYSWEQDFPQDPVKIQSPPSGYEAMVFNFGEPYIIDTVTASGIVSPRAFYSGQNTGNYEMHLRGAIRIFGVVLQPAAFSRLFRVSVKGTVDNRLPLRQLLGGEGDTLSRKVSEAQSVEERVSLLNDVLLQKLWINRLHEDPADEAARMIMDHQGKLPLGQLTKKLQCGRRTLQRKFVDKLGVSPKMFARICRFSYMSYLLMYRKADWPELVYEGGFTDQSHFIREFQYFNRQKPSEYLKHHQELVKYLK